MTARRRTSFGLDHAATKNIEYGTVKGILANWTDGAILLSGDNLPMQTWIPRQALDALSRALVYRTAKGAEIEIRLPLKMAMEKNLV